MRDIVLHCAMHFCIGYVRLHIHNIELRCIIIVLLHIDGTLETLSVAMSLAYAYNLSHTMSMCKMCTLQGHWEPRVSNKAERATMLLND